MPRLHYPKRRPDDSDDRPLWPLNVWDCFRLGRPPLFASYPHRLEHPHHRLFGNAHIGMTECCNLYVPGQLATDAHAWVEHVYARTDIDLELCSPRLRAAWHMWTSRTQVEFVVGDRPVIGWSLKELLEQGPWEPLSVTEAKQPTEEERQAFRKRALARREEGGYPHWVPVRQNVSVCINAAPLERVLDALDTIDLTTWIHLEGYKQMVVC